MSAGETFAGFPPLFYKSRRRRSDLQRKSKMLQKETPPGGWCFFFGARVDKKDAGAKLCAARVCWLLRIRFSVLQFEPPSIL